MRRPTISYANVVATLALFIALGGVSWAAVKLPKNSVGSKQIKKNAVTSAKIKKNSIVSSKIKNGAIQGSDINLGSLGKVPSAVIADSAADAFQKTIRVNSSATAATENSGRDAATPVELVTIGAFTVYAKCFYDSVQNRVFGEMYIRSSIDGAIWAGYNYGDGDGLNIGTPETDRRLIYTSASADDTNADYDYDTPMALSPDGNGIKFSNTLFIRNGNPGNPSAMYTSDKACVFATRGYKIKL